MPESLFECASFKLECDAQYDKSWAWTYFRCWHIIVFEKDTRGGVSHIFKRYSKCLK